MKRTKLIFAALILAALFALKAIFPDFTSNILSTAKSAFSRDIDYRQVLTDIGDNISTFREDKDPMQETAAESGEKTYSAIIVPAQIEHGSSSAAELSWDFAENEGEETVELPSVVATFIESQKSYSALELPENVSYDFRVFPGEQAVPVEGHNSSGFGYRTHPIHGDVRFHYGTDFAAWTGESILAFAEGTVSFAGYSESYGNYITIDHSDGWQSLYAHCSALCVEEGDSVEAGEKIALVGDTGLVTGPHLHFELTKDGVYTNPEYYVN